MINKEIATVGGGCFWCVEAVVQRLKGVEKVVSGYAGGSSKNPSYREVCTGNTGHAEVVQITFDPSQISYKDLLTIFMTTHDPTTLNRQGADRGTQYRSVVFYANEEQKLITEQVIAELKDTFDDPIVTQVLPLPTFYEAEADHQNYYNLHPEAGFCSMVISPKVQKLRKLYAGHLKPSEA
ncbi:peptide-methionine (S)-S-oxide reductase MsrA [Dyadobacter tibetensis]|uniref:peptide-methionine (S)-S-oxide reductase MsrA n=1 Tax=Dyadobacter tibetensis TaxID=1211851 RepID=UPI00047283F3|nr:peptide-methionine (S)-S-oxide reductase MsrA [Dyadobacter tibetensis]